MTTNAVQQRDELLEALQGMVEFFDDCKALETEDGQPWDVVTTARAAIAKAEEGERGGDAGGKVT